MGWMGFAADGWAAVPRHRKRLWWLGAIAVLTSACFTLAKSPLAGEVRLPPFETLPPGAVSHELPPGVVVAAAPEALREPHQRLVTALERAGFDKWSVYAHGDGFALVTRWERIEEDGRPAKDRFPVRHIQRIAPGFDLDSHVQLLFNAPDGEYRMFVFLVSGKSGERSADVPIDGDDVDAGGLPDEIAGREGGGRVATAHVYLYSQRGDMKAQPAPSEQDAATHLSRAGIF